MRLAAVQFDIAWEGKDANWSTMSRLLQAAQLPQGSLAVLPELADTGFSMNTEVVASGESLAKAQALARQCGIALAAGHGVAAKPQAGGGHAHEKPLPCNACTLVRADGSCAGTYRKIHLFSPSREHEHFVPGRSVCVLPLRSGGEMWQVCPLICYDLRYPELFRIAALAGAEVFVLGACWPAARAHHWRALAIARAIENQAFVVACNRIGTDPQTSYAGGSLIVAPDGTVMAEAGAEESVIHADADRSTLLRWRDRFPALRDAHRSLLGDVAIEVAPIH